YHRTPHSSLMGKTPAEAFEVAPRKPVDETLLSEALVARGRRRIRRDGTVQIAGTDFEVAQGFLAGRLVPIGRSFLDPRSPPWVEHEDQRFTLTPVDPKKSGSRKRSSSLRQGIDAVAFDPPGVLLDQVLGRKAGES
ncbi:MAG: transposase, partial [Polyangiaceae bacterium]